MRASAPDGERPRATVDSNLFVSGMISRGAPKNLLDAWDHGDFSLVLSQSMVSELGEVLRRPSIRKKYELAEDRIRQLEQGISRFAEVLEELAPLPSDLTVRDPKDEHVLQTALTGRVGYLITGDDDLLSLNGHELLGELRILTVNEFLVLLERRR